MTPQKSKTPAPFPTVKDLPLDAVRLDGGTQPRVRIDAATVREYAERMKAGDQFPPVQAYFDGTDHWLSDGFHRVKAAQEAGLKAVQAEVWEGTRDDAFWMSLAANKDHGLRRTNEDKARAVKAALAAKSCLSDAVIAEHVGVSDRMVSKYRVKVTPKISESSKRTGRDGRTTNTANIGKRKRRSQAAGPPNPDDVPMDAAGEPVTDRLGQTVEGKVAEAFRRRKEVQNLMTAVSRIKSTVLAAVEAKDPLFADILPSRFQADCGNLYRQLKATLPHAACPYCRAGRVQGLPGPRLGERGRVRAGARGTPVPPSGGD